MERGREESELAIENGMEDLGEEDLFCVVCRSRVCLGIYEFEEERGLVSVPNKTLERNTNVKVTNRQQTITNFEKPRIKISNWAGFGNTQPTCKPSYLLLHLYFTQHIFYYFYILFYIVFYLSLFALIKF